MRISSYFLNVLYCVTAAHYAKFIQDLENTVTHDALMMTPDVVSQSLGLVTGVWLKLTQTFRQSSTCLQLSERQIPRNVYEIIPSAAQKSYSSSVTHSVIGWGNERIKKWGREDTRISTDKKVRSFLPVRRPNSIFTGEDDTLALRLFA